MKSLFYKKLRCKNCSKGMKLKTERGIKKYICSTYDTTRGCKRIIVKEDYLIDLLLRRFKTEDIQSHIQKVKLIEVEDSDEIIIHFHEDDPIVVSYKGKIYKY
jgi:hypothetical protein